MKKPVTNEYIMKELQRISDRLADCWSGPLRDAPKKLEEIGTRLFNLELDIQQGCRD